MVCYSNPTAERVASGWCFTIILAPLRFEIEREFGINKWKEEFGMKVKFYIGTTFKGFPRFSRSRRADLNGRRVAVHVHSVALAYT